MADTREDVVIVGAGPAGLALGVALQERGCVPVLLDEADEVGRPWANRHDQLRLNTHRRFSGQPGRPMPRSFGAFPSRDDYLTYLRERAEEVDRLRLGVSVHRIERLEDSWAVQTNEGTVVTEQVVVATGADRVPHIPEWPGRESFTGELVHAGRFEHARHYEGRRALLVGIGNSAVDIGNYLSDVDLGESWVSVRNGSHIAPQYVLGIPAHLLLIMSKWQPVWLQDRSITLLSRLVLGDLTKLGIPPAPKGPVSRSLEDGVTAAPDNGFVAALKAGRFGIVPEIERIEGDVVVLVDGSELEPDVIIAATGYRLGLEELVGHLDVLDAAGRPRFMVDEADPACPGLWFFGLNSSIYGNMYLRLKETDRVATAICRMRSR